MCRKTCFCRSSRLIGVGIDLLQADPVALGVPEGLDGVAVCADHAVFHGTDEEVVATGIAGQLGAPSSRRRS
jgi:hypothetical protein